MKHLEKHRMENSAFFCHSDLTWNQFWRMLKFQTYHFCNFRGSYFHLGQSQPSKNAKYRASKCDKTAIFGVGPPKSLKLISRKFCVARKFLKIPQGIWFDEKTYCKSGFLTSDFDTISETCWNSRFYSIFWFHQQNEHPNQKIQ